MRKTIKKMFNVFKALFSVKRWKILLKNLRHLSSELIEDDLFKVKDEAIYDTVMEFDDIKNELQNVYINVINNNDTLDLLLNNPKSFARFGDGEVDYMLGNGCSLQSYDSVLAEKLNNIILNNNNNIYVGINCSYWMSPLNFSDRNYKFYRINSTSLRKRFASVCNRNTVYLDACCFGGYFRFKEDYDFTSHFKKVKSLFRNKKIAIVAGKGIMEDISYNIFEYASDIKYIDAPRTNAFSQYEQIINNVVTTVSNDFLIIIMLGITATALAYDLTQNGYIAWDFGHAVADYDAYMKNIDRNDTNWFLKSYGY